MRLSACVMAAILIGGCGSEGDDAAAVPAQAPGAAVTVELPPELPGSAPQPQTEPEEEAPAPAAQEAKAEPEPAEKAEKAKPPVETAQKAVPAPEPSTPAAAGEESAEAAPSSEPTLVRARLPLSEAQLVRTIERIGYECGSVVGADRQEGEGEPVYRINCSSGAAYRGTTRNGRLFFRPWGSARSRR